MGYTHYMTRSRGFTDREWQTLTEATRALLDNLPQHSTSAGGCYAAYPLVLAGPDGEGLPVVDDREISFNGTWDDDLWHETFFLAREIDRDMETRTDGGWFSFCKTARKPYDLAVVAVMEMARRICPAFSWRSDGHADDLRDGIALADSILRETARQSEDTTGRRMTVSLHSDKSFVWSRNGAPDISGVFVWTGDGPGGAQKISIQGVAGRGNHVVDRSGFMWLSVRDAREIAAALLRVADAAAEREWERNSASRASQEEW